jgi:hypothetical protein
LRSGFYPKAITGRRLPEGDYWRGVFVISTSRISTSRLASRTIEVTSVSSPADLREFQRLPRLLRGADPRWVEPLRSEQAGLLDRARHPFWRDGEGATGELFLARDRRTGLVVGRVASIMNARYVSHRRDADPTAPVEGFFGFFDSIDDPEVAAALVEAAAGWLRERGAVEMIGPASPSQNYEYGLLIEGHERPHGYLLAHQPAYYQRLLEGAGLVKAKDMLAATHDAEDPEQQARLEAWKARAERAAGSKDRGIVVRSLDPARFDDEVGTAVRLFNDVLSRHWGHVPLSPGEMADITRDLRHVIIPDLVFFAEREGEPVGILVSLPDPNAWIGRLRLRTGALALIELATRMRAHRPQAVRVVLCGVVRDLTRVGVAAAMIWRFFDAAGRLGFRYMDAGWVFEDNEAMLKTVLTSGMKLDRRYRLYRLPLDRAGAWPGIAPPGTRELAPLRTTEN